MPVFEYRGLSESGKAVTGLLEADSAKTLRAQLRKTGVFLTEVLGQQAEGGARPGRAAAGGKKSATGEMAGTVSLSQDVNLRRLTRARITSDDIAIMTRQ